MRCPICFSAAQPRGKDIPITEIHRRLLNLIRVSNGPIPLQISGGEPTIRKDLPEIVNMARRMGFVNIDLITNGIVISRSLPFLMKLKEKGLKAVYLQFDGLRKKTHEMLRGQDMRVVRRQAVENIRSAQLCATLAVAVTRGVNENEISNIVRYAVENADTVRAINFQSATQFRGRFDIESEKPGFSLKELLNLIEGQTTVPASSFISDHIGGAGCNALSLVFIHKNHLEPLFKHLKHETLIEFLGERPRERILGLFAGKRDFFRRHLQSLSAWRLLREAAPAFGGNPLDVMRRRHILLFAKSFMECGQLAPNRLNNCCYGISDSKGVFSLCAFNNLYRFPGSAINHTEM
jgi:uncharacterized radical SAM superfamily Fe-S cluster-containing enzyme